MVTQVNIWTCQIYTWGWDFILETNTNIGGNRDVRSAILKMQGWWCGERLHNVGVQDQSWNITTYANNYTLNGFMSWWNARYMRNYCCEWETDLGHESVRVWVWAEDHVGMTWVSWCDRIHVGVINGVTITQSWAGVGQQCHEVLWDVTLWFPAKKHSQGERPHH